MLAAKERRVFAAAGSCWSSTAELGVPDHEHCRSGEEQPAHPARLFWRGSGGCWGSWQAAVSVPAPGAAHGGHRQRRLLCGGGVASALKKLTVELEDRCKIGRLLDLDVLDSRGEKAERQAMGLSARRAWSAATRRGPAPGAGDMGFRSCGNAQKPSCGRPLPGKMGRLWRSWPAGVCCMRSVSPQSRGWWTGKTAAATGIWIFSPS